jgi:hypothetical protein
MAMGMTPELHREHHVSIWETILCLCVISWWLVIMLIVMGQWPALKCHASGWNFAQVIRNSPWLYEGSSIPSLYSCLSLYIVHCDCRRFWHSCNAQWKEQNWVHEIVDTTHYVACLFLAPLMGNSGNSQQQDTKSGILWFLEMLGRSELKPVAGLHTSALGSTSQSCFLPGLCLLVHNCFAQWHPD